MARLIGGGVGGGSSSPLTTKGDIWSFDTADNRFPVGLVNGQVLAVDSAEAFGMKWIDAVTILGNAGEVCYFATASSVVGLADGTAGQVLSTDGAGNLSWITVGGGGGTPASPDTSVQFNNGGAFGGDSALTWDNTNKNLIVGASNTVTGQGNLVSGWTNAVGGNLNLVSGEGNTVNGTWSGAIGVGHNVGGGHSVAIGDGHQLPASNAFAAGSLNRVTNTNGSAFGQGALATRFGEIAYTSKTWSPSGVLGQAQGSLIVGGTDSPNDTPREVELNYGVDQFVVLEDNTSNYFEVIVVGRNVDTGLQSAVYKFEGLVTRGVGAATVAVFGMVKTTMYEDDTNWDANVDADTTNGRLRTTVTGVAATNIRWAAHYRLVQVKG